MLAEERFALILNLLAEKRTATVQELCEALNASESTIRRDLTELDRQGRLNKVHGGATLPDGQFLADEPTMAAKETLAVGQKRSIAQAAADLVRAGDFVYIDAGSTTLELVRALEGGALQANYVTNGVDKGSGSRRNGPLLGHGQRLLGLHGGFLGLEAAVRQSGSTVHLVQLAQPVQLRQVTPDGGLAGAQRLAQLLHGSRALFIQQI